MNEQTNKQTNRVQLLPLSLKNSLKSLPCCEEVQVQALTAMEKHTCGCPSQHPMLEQNELKTQGASPQSYISKLILFGANKLQGCFLCNNNS